MSAEKQKTILLVDDEAIIAMTEKMALEKYGYSVMIAHTGEDAVAAIAKTPAIDLILMDINLGSGMDGTQAAAAILKDRDLPVVFLSSHMEQEVVEKTEKITSYGYVVKGSSVTVLDASIKMAFKLFEAKIIANAKTEALRKSEEKYHTLFREMLEGFALHGIICDDAGAPVDYRFLAVNQAFERMTGLKASELIGRTVLEVMPGTERHWIETYGRVAISGEPALFENYSAVLNKYFKVTAFQPAPGQFACIFIDITERELAGKVLRESEEQFRTLGTMAPLGIYLTDTRGRCRYANPRWCEMAGLTLEEAIGEGWTRGLHPDDREAVFAAWQKTIASAGRWGLEYRFRTREGKVTSATPRV
jgi:PAS domain S-box-containing protein